VNKKGLNVVIKIYSIEIRRIKFQTQLLLHIRKSSDHSPWYN